MARRTDSLIVVTGVLLAETPLHVGGAGASTETDLPLAVDGRGRPYMPGTSIAGAVRSWLNRGLGGEATGDDKSPGQGEARSVFGHGERKQTVESETAENERADPERDARIKKAQGVASRIVIDDAYVDGAAAVEIRDHVGIDRFSGAAHEGIKYDRQLLPRGARLAFRMEVELAEHDQAGEEQPEAFRRNMAEDRRRVAAVVAALVDGRIRFGAAKTRGLGRMRLVDARAREFEVDKAKAPAGHGGTFRGILELAKARAKGTRLDGSPPDRAGLLAEIGGGTEGFPAPPVLTITLRWAPDGPVMVKAGTDGLGVDMLPLVAGTGEKKAGKDALAQVITGSAVKGRLRSHAEMIAATVFDSAALTADGRGRTRFLEQLSRAPLVETLFGIPGPAKNDEKDAIGRGLGAVHVDDCFVEGRRITLAEWQELAATGKDANGGGMRGVGSALAAMGWGGDDPAAHVAIDRWTGGAAERFLFTALEPRADKWAPIVIEVALDRLRPGPSDAVRPGIEDGEGAARDAAVALLFLALRDLASGGLPLGYGGNRGYGAVKITGLAFKAEGAASDAVKALDGWSASVDPKEPAGAILATLAAEPGRLRSLEEQWLTFVDGRRTGG